MFPIVNYFKDLHNNESQEDSLNGITSSFHSKVKIFSKECVVILAFVVPLSTTVTNIFSLLLFISWLLSDKLSQKIKLILQHTIVKATLLFFSIFLIGALYSVGNNKDIIESLGKISKLPLITILIDLGKEEKWRHRAIFAFVSAMIITLLLGILKTYGMFPNYTSRYTLGCVFKDHIYTSLMMAFAIFIIGHYVFEKPFTLFCVALYVLLATCIFYVFFINRGRVGYIMFASLLILFCLQRLTKIKSAAIIFTSLVLFLAFSYSKSAPFKEGINFAISDLKQYKSGRSHTSLGLRLEYTQQTFKLFKKRPWFGFGTGSFKKVYQENAIIDNLQPTNNPHNEYMNILLQLGIFGLFSFLIFLGTILKYSFSCKKPEQWLLQGVVLAIGLGCLGNSWLMDFTSGYFFVVLVGLCCSASCYLSTREKVLGLNRRTSIFDLAQ